jgi:hypothetical protein
MMTSRAESALRVNRPPRGQQGELVPKGGHRHRILPALIPTARVASFAVGDFKTKSRRVQNEAARSRGNARLTRNAESECWRIMSRFGIRPRFTQTVDLRLEEAQARLSRAVGVGADRCEMKVFPGFICLRIPEHDRHFWSPRLNLGLEPTGDGKTRIEGIYEAAMGRTVEIR